MTIDRTPLDDLVNRFAAERHCPTIAWGVVGDGQLLTTGAVGDVDHNTVYRIASMTKSFSAAATLALRDSGTLRLDDPIDLYQPELRSIRSATDDAPVPTIRDLLSMTSGLATDDPWADRHLDLTNAEFDAIVRGGLIFGEPTGVEFEYSNFGYAVLGRVIERASGRRIQDVITQDLLWPLGMADTSWVVPDHGRWAPPLRWVDDHHEPELAPLDDGLIAPMGGIWTTVADLCRWISWLDDGFPARDGDDLGPLRRASRREMQIVQRNVGHRVVRDVKMPTGYGYGLRVLDDPVVGTVVTHSGGLPGYGSNMRWLRGRKVGVIALSNVTYAPMTELTARLLDLVYEQLVAGGAEPRPSRPVGSELAEMAQRLIALLNQWDEAEALSLFADNVEPDEDFARRITGAQRWLAGAGPISIENVTATSDAAASVTCITADGSRRTVTFSLAPARPARIQDYDLKQA